MRAIISRWIATNGVRYCAPECFRATRQHTIWDADILIYRASVLADMARRGVNDVPRKLHLMPYDLLRAIGRPTTGRAYELLDQLLDRLVATTIKTNNRAENRREAAFSWLDGWTQRNLFKIAVLFTDR